MFDDMPDELKKQIKEALASMGANADEVMKKLDIVFISFEKPIDDKPTEDQVRVLMNMLMSKLQSTFTMMHAVHSGAFGKTDMNSHVISGIIDVGIVARQFANSVDRVYGDVEAMQQHENHQKLKNRMFDDLIEPGNGNN